MNTILAQMVAGRRSAGAVRFAYALRESIQQIVLLGFWCARFFENASFYGGTALRLVHGLDRFSEDLDFSLLEPDHLFDMASWRMPVICELGAFGIDVAVSPAKEKPPGLPFTYRRQRKKVFGIWESLYNPNFKLLGIEGVKTGGAQCL